MAEDLTNDTPQFLGDPMAVPPDGATPAVSAQPVPPTVPQAAPAAAANAATPPSAPKPEAPSQVSPAAQAEVIPPRQPAAAAPRPTPATGQPSAGPVAGQPPAGAPPRAAASPQRAPTAAPRAPATAPRTAAPRPAAPGSSPAAPGPIIRRTTNSPPQTYPLAPDVTPVRTGASRGPAQRGAAPRHDAQPSRGGPLRIGVGRSYRIEGFLCLIVAGAWGYGANWIYHQVGTLVLLNSANQLAKDSNVRSSPAVGSTTPRTTRRSSNSLSFFPPDTSAPPDPSVRSPRRATGLDSAIAGAADSASADAGQLAARMLSFGEGTRIVWTLGTFIAAGIIATCGIAAFCRSAPGRTAAYGGMGIALGAAAAGLAVARYTRPVEYGPGVNGWMKWIETATQTPYAWTVYFIIAGVVAMLLGLLALRPASRPRRWIVAAIMTMFAGTALSLVAVSIMQEQGGFPPLPAWVSVALTLAQTGVAAILILMLGFRREVLSHAAR